MTITTPPAGGGPVSVVLVPRGDTPPGAVVASVRTEPAAPQAGSPVTLELALTDGSTGALVDDLTVHDDALIHLAVIGPDRRLDHVHPVRVAPGRYRVTVPPVVAGRHGAFAELERGRGRPPGGAHGLRLAGPRRPGGARRRAGRRRAVVTRRRVSGRCASATRR